MADEVVNEVSEAQPAVPVAASEATPAADAAAPVTEPVAKAAKRAVKAAAPVIEAVRAVNAKAARTARKAKAKRAAAPQQPTTTTHSADESAPIFERINAMTYDFTKLFGGYELAGADKVQAFFADAGEKGQELARKSQANIEEMTDLARANVEAVVEAGRIAAAGAKSLGEELIAKGREGFEEASASVKSLAEATSPVEYFQLQGELAKTAFDRMVAEGSALTERMVKLAGEAAQPLQTRASVVAERMNKLVA